MKRPAVLVAAALLAGCGFLPREEKVLAPPLLTAPEVVYDTVAASRGTIENRITISATFTPAEQQSLTFRFLSGRLKALHVKLGDAVKVGDLVAELDTGGLENQIARLTLLVRKAQLAAERTVALGQDRFSRESASLDVDLAKLDLAEAQDELEQSRLYAPSAGSVVYTGSANEGDPVSAWQTVVQIADLRNLRLVYTGGKASEFQVGMKVSVSLGDHTTAGEVVMAPGSVPADAPDELRQAVVVRLAKTPADAHSGGSASVSVVLARRENVIVIPVDLVHNYLGRTYVQVLTNGVKSERTIELGLQTTTEAEVISGLSPGDQLVRQ
jgi:RND family efflux transporter MFP subunit